MSLLTKYRMICGWDVVKNTMFGNDLFKCWNYLLRLDVQEYLARVRGGRFHNGQCRSDGLTHMTVDALGRHGIKLTLARQTNDEIVFSEKIGH